MTGILAALAVSMSLVAIDGHNVLRIGGLKKNTPIRVCITPTKTCLDEVSGPNGEANVNIDGVDMLGPRQARIEQQHKNKSWKEVATIDLITVYSIKDRH